jgi:hypothetical protein
LFQNCPWLAKLSIMSPEQSAIDEPPPTPSAKKLQAPWTSAFHALEQPSDDPTPPTQPTPPTHALMERQTSTTHRDLERQTSSSSSGFSSCPVDMTAQNFVLMPVPKMRRTPSLPNSSSANGTPSASPPLGSAPSSKEGSGLRRSSIAELRELDECVLQGE